MQSQTKLMQKLLTYELTNICTYHTYTYTPIRTHTSSNPSKPKQTKATQTKVNQSKQQSNNWEDFKAKPNTLGESYPWINEVPSFSCRSPDLVSSGKAPNFIHMASNFKAPDSEEWMFHKGHVPAKILDCGTPLIVEAPDDLWRISNKKEKKQKEKKKK